MSGLRLHLARVNRDWRNRLTRRNKEPRNMKTFTLELGVMRDGVVHWEPLRTYETKAECANAVIWRAHFIPGDPEERYRIVEGRRGGQHKTKTER